MWSSRRAGTQSSVRVLLFLSEPTKHGFLLLENFLMPFTLLFAAAFLVGADSCRASPPSRAAVTSASAAERSKLAWLPPASQSQQKVFAYLEAKVGHKVYRPDPPTAEGYTGQWFFARQPSTTDPQIVYPLIYENLLVAKKLLRSPSDADREEGLVVARYSNLWLRQSLHDLTLSPRLVEAFLLPYLDAAYSEDWRTVSRRQILEDANDAYQGTHEVLHQAAVLRLLIHSGSGANTTDWARMELGELQAAQGRYDEAADTVEAITDPGMSGGKALGAGWRKQADAQAKASAAQPVLDDPQARNNSIHPKK